MAVRVHSLLRRRFQVLLIALVLLQAVFPLMRGVKAERVLFDILVTSVFLTALIVVFTKHSLRIVALVLGIPSLLGIWTGYALPGIPEESLTLVFHVLATLFLVFCVTTILQTAYNEDTVSADSVYGAFCGYLLIGLAFGHLYCILESFMPGSYGGSESIMHDLQIHQRRRFLLTYFSYATLTTVGYGDITPTSDTARGLAMVEAIVGQFYIAVLVAELIGKRVAQMLSGPPPDPGK